ncbi:hypothetical protein D3C87_1516890 [compost metagenome]
MVWPGSTRPSERGACPGVMDHNSSARPSASATRSCMGCTARRLSGNVFTTMAPGAFSPDSTATVRTSVGVGAGLSIRKASTTTAVAKPADKARHQDRPRGAEGVRVAAEVGTDLGVAAMRAAIACQTCAGGVSGGRAIASGNSRSSHSVTARRRPASSRIRVMKRCRAPARKPPSTYSAARRSCSSGWR